MSFDAPGGLWLLGAIPLIILLWLLRPRRPRVRIPSVLLWPSSTAERRSARPWQRLRNHPLLWLQLLIALLLALAAAQPYIPAEAADQRIVVLLDASGSMRAHDVLPSRWDVARAAVVDIARTLGPDQSLSLIRVDDQPRVLLADVREPARVEAVLSSETASFGPIDATTSVSLAAGLAKGSPSEWVLVGDGQFPDLPSGVGVPSGTHFRFVRIGAESAANIALTGLTLRANGAAFAAQVGVRNASDASAGGTVQLLAEGGNIVASSDWSAGPRQDAFVTWAGVPFGPTWFAAALASVDPPSANVLDTDDRAWAVPPPGSSSQQRALLVSAGNTFLERMLAVEGQLRTFKVPPADWAGLVAQGDAATYALVVLDRQPRESTPSPRGSALYVGGVSGAAFQPRIIAPIADHPLLRNVDWADVRIGRATRLAADQYANWQTVVDSDGGPLLVVRTLQDGNQVRREALLTFDLTESDLPLRPAFPVLMANILEWLSPRPDGNPQTVAPGTSLQLEASPLARSLRVEAIDSSGPAVELAPPWTARAFRPATPGVYRAIEDDPDGPVTTYIVADAFAPSEADLTPREPVALSSQGTQTNDLALAQVLRSVRSGIWPWLLAGMLGLGALEWLTDARGR